MNKFTTREGIELFYEDEFFGKPWMRDEAEVILLIHGTGEHSKAWYAWVPELGSDYRVIRPDLPGYGGSRMMRDPDSYSWKTSRLAADLRQLVDALAIKRLHIVGAKYGGSVAVEFAASNLDVTASLAVVGGPVQVAGQSTNVDVADFPKQIERDIRKWADDSMDKRLGRHVPPAQRQWWVDMMASSNPVAARACATETGYLDLLALLRQVKVPILFITTNGNQLVPLEHYERWQKEIGAELLVIDGDDYHPAAMHAQESIAAVKNHVGRVGWARE